MIQSYRHGGRPVLIFFWISFLLFNAGEGRRYDKCVTSDSRQGVCVLKRYCREANHQTLLPCDGDSEIYCCPIPTTQRSAANIPNRPDERRLPPPREPDRDDRLNKTPPPADRRSPARHDSTLPKKHPARDKEDDSGSERRRPIPPQHNPQDLPDIYGHNGDVGRTRPNVADRRDHHTRRPDRDRVYPSKDDWQNARDPEPSRREDPPAKDDWQNARELEPPRREDPPAKRDWQNARDPEPPRREDPPAKDDRENTRNPEPRRRINPRKNVTNEFSTASIRFPDPYEFSVPSPKVPACGVKPYELFIAGGTESDEHEWPWMTAIFLRYPDSRPKTFLCGGSLINTKYVLTAAHCFVRNYVILPASSFVVRVGSHFLDSGEDYTVSNLVLHHNHSGSDFFNDIALVRLASEVYVTDKVAPICLPDPNMIYDNLVDRMATVAGWGDTSFRTGHSRILQHVTVPIVSGEECFAAYSRVRGAAFLARGSDHVICAGLREGGKDACLGDSGGPLMLKMPDDRWVVIGIVSLGYKCAEPGYPGVYTRVTHYTSWINTNMKRH